MNKIKKYVTVLSGLLLMAISFNLFQAPYNLVCGGITGLSIVVNHFFNINESLFIFLVNQSLIILSFVLLGKKKTLNTILGSILLPCFILLTKPLANIISFANLDMILISILGGLIYGVGLGLIYKKGYTSGGTDILNQIAEVKYKIPINKSIIIIDGLIVLLSLLAFDVETMIYSLITLVIISYISNNTFLELNRNKVFYIYTEEPQKVKEYLIDNFAYDLTVFESIGGFTKKSKELFMCSVSTKDYYIIKEGILYIDPKAFIVITNAYEQKNANVLIRNTVNKN